MHNVNTGPPINTKAVDLITKAVFVDAAAESDFTYLVVNNVCPRDFSVIFRLQWLWLCPDFHPTHYIDS